VNFDGEETKPTYAEYCSFLKERVPKLFDPSLFATVITEFGRSVIAKVCVNIISSHLHSLFWLLLNQFKKTISLDRFDSDESRVY